MSRPMLLVVLAAPACALAGCSLLTSLDGLSGGASPDGGAVVVVPDAGSAISESGDATLAARACAQLSPAPFLCVDFDDDADLTSVFDGMTFTGGGAWVVDSTDSRSAPKSLEITLPTGSSSAYFRKQLPSVFTRLTVDLDLRVNDRGAGDAYDFVEFTHSNSREMSLEITPAGVLQFDEDTSGADIKTPTTFTFDPAWRHVTCSVTVAGAGAVTSVLVDGKPVGQTSTSSQIFADATLIIGDKSAGSVTKPWKVRYDNIVVRINDGP